MPYPFTAFSVASLYTPPDLPGWGGKSTIDALREASRLNKVELLPMTLAQIPAINCKQEETDTVA